MFFTFDYLFMRVLLLVVVLGYDAYTHWRAAHCYLLQVITEQRVGRLGIVGKIIHNLRTLRVARFSISPLAFRRERCFKHL